ncbi:MAG: hypothetical protein NC925_03615, partial [Candidatus Omnitrophica bacterium]|nr:hypothetical protein [Candidatus Omnitrophota bacterium]
IEEKRNILEEASLQLTTYLNNIQLFNIHLQGLYPPDIASSYKTALKLEFLRPGIYNLECLMESYYYDGNLIILFFD